MNTFRYFQTLFNAIFIIFSFGINYAKADAPAVPSGYLSYPDTANTSPLTYNLLCSDRKLAILIHGWTMSSYPPSNPNSFNDGGDMSYLDASLYSYLYGSDVQLLNYHWENDASTGGISWTGDLIAG